MRVAFCVGDGVACSCLDEFLLPALTQAAIVAHVRLLLCASWRQLYYSRMSKKQISLKVLHMHLSQVQKNVSVAKGEVTHGAEHSQQLKVCAGSRAG
jgi:hypothetical protein